MLARDLLAPEVSAPLGESRARVLELLRAASSPLGVQDIASRTGLHPNTARFHLDALVGAGLATRGTQPRGTPGRPSLAYSPTETGEVAGQRHYLLLAEMLTSMIGGAIPRPQEAAAAAGREWGRYLTAPTPPYERLEADPAVARLTETLDDIGFAPRAEGQDGSYQLRLRQCPFREVAERHQDVVCSLHLGLMQGVLAQLRAPVTAQRLQPFAEPGVCIAQLASGHQNDDA